LYDQRGKATADLLSLAREDPRVMERITLHHPSDHAQYRTLAQNEISEIEPLLVEIMRDGQVVYDLPSIEAMRERRRADIERLDPGVKRLINPHIYHVSLTEELWKLKQSLIASFVD
jgi:nicotinate phosphoribosyltransferase